MAKKKKFPILPLIPYVPEPSERHYPRPINVPYRPLITASDDSLWEYAVKHLADLHKGKSTIYEAHLHNQWANICFGYPGQTAYERKDKMSRIKDSFRPYFKRSKGASYAFDIDLILEDFPHFFEGYKKSKSSESIIDKMISAVLTEIKLSKQQNKRLRYKVTKIYTIDASNLLYQLQLDLGDDDLLSFYEGAKINFKTGENRYYCEAIDYDANDTTLVVKSNLKITGTSGSIFIDTSFILQAVVEKLNVIKDKGFEAGQPGLKFLSNKTRQLTPFTKFPAAYLPIVGKMDDSQRNAHDAAIKNDISFIWGPPGTGKSFTLAGLINSFYRDKQSTLVCCISNVAVDQLLNKTLDVVEDLGLSPESGEILRAGTTTDERLLGIDYLFPRDKETKKLRASIQDLNERIKKLSKERNQVSVDLKITLLKQKRLELRDLLKTKTESLITGSNIVFSTIANYILSSQLANKKFDNLIVDEVSMLSMPNLMAIALNIFKRIILVGDPNQLGPIAISPNKLLTNNIFDYCNIFTSEEKHPALHQLLTQRRSHKSIVNLTNKVFYMDKLKAVNFHSPSWVLKGPFPGLIIKTINQLTDENETKMIGSSRRNFGTFEEVMRIIDKYYSYCTRKQDYFSIGIITPYRAQVKLYHAEIRKKYNGTRFYEYLKIGTIHTFQGSECDLIIFDLVEKGPTKVSQILNQKDGERLITVALSRARHKMIFVGDNKRFNGGPGLALVTSKVCRVLSTLSDIKAISKNTEA